MRDDFAPEPQESERRLDEVMYYLRLLSLHGYTGGFYVKFVRGRVSRETWKRVVHGARHQLTSLVPKEVATHAA